MARLPGRRPVPPALAGARGGRVRVRRHLRPARRRQRRPRRAARRAQGRAALDGHRRLGDARAFLCHQRAVGAGAALRRGAPQ
eukprot:scaffold35217_cov26-Phaeocystis_antarctica.AAC.1